MKFGERLRITRERKGLSQKELASRSGSSLRTITGYETEGRYPRYRTQYDKLAQALGVHVSDLLDPEEYFIHEAAKEYGPRGKKGAQKLVNELAGLFAGGEMADEDMDEMMLALQDAYKIAKERNKKYTPKKYL